MSPARLPASKAGVPGADAPAPNGNCADAESKPENAAIATRGGRDVEDEREKGERDGLSAEFES